MIILSPGPTRRLCNSCTECSLGSYARVGCSETANTVCEPCTTCSAGLYSAGCGPSSDGTCTPYSPACTASEFEEVPPGQYNDRVCTPYSPSCTPFLEKQVQAPTATSDRVCAPNTCPTGEYATMPATPTSDPYV